jgi:hypothetical protein
MMYRLLVVLFPLVNSLAAAEPVQFSREVLPILSLNCYACHGPDEHERKGKLRLDLEAEAKREHDDGFPIVPGQPDKSTIISRLLTTDPDDVMPPPKAHKTVKPAQVETLRRWIAEGAKWGKHWSFEPVVRPETPAGSNGIDGLVRKELAAKGLEPRKPALPQTLVRRLYLDLIGLPPTPEQADAFAAQASPEAYTKLVDELLAKPQFGEHWARMWLDLMRYADTKGYEKDLGRTMWPWRDWVVKAFNDDLPLPQFTEEQLAGDLIANATEQQKVATACHRNTMSNDEGGTDDEEFRQVAVKDRVDTTMQVWMGLTMGCAKCHTHKYDPISQSEYYQLFAMFNQTEDADRGDDSPVMAIAAGDNPARKALEARLQDAQTVLAPFEKSHAAQVAEQEKLWTAPKVLAATAEGATLTVQADGSVLATGKKPERDIYTVKLSLPAGTWHTLRLEALPEKGKLGRNSADPNFVVSELSALVSGKDKQVPLQNPQADFAQNGWPVSGAIDGKPETGWAISPRRNERHVATFDFAKPLTVAQPTEISVVLSQQYGQQLTLQRFRLSVTNATAAQLTSPVASPELAQARSAVESTKAELKKLDDTRPKLPVFRELAEGKQRVTKIHKRGNFLDPGDTVVAAVPTAFHPLSTNEKANRLGLARWLTSKENPLTPRVWANRIWARLFGVGIVETEEDFGALGLPPSNPALLDWLAAEYRDRGWSNKRLLRSIVLSETYRQASESDENLAKTDPRNFLISRGSRFRLGAETIRDQALAVSGLLSMKMSGPPVMPPQPTGLWRSTYNGLKWVDAEGDDRYRRGLYTYLKRTTPYPTMTTFDGGSGEVCQIRRIRTNTPLQALVVLNDPVYLEAAAALAKRMVEAGPDDATRASRGLRLALIRPLHANEIDPLLKLQMDALTKFTAAPTQAADFLKTVRGQTPQGCSEAAFAAWVVTANAILNLDEFLSRN